MIVQSYIRAEKWDTVAAFGQLATKVDPNGVLRQSSKLKNDIKNSSFSEAIAWAEENVLFENDGSQVVFKLKLTQLLTLCKTEPAEVIFNLYKSSFSSFWPQKEEELGKLGVFLTILFGYPKEMDKEL